MAERDFSLEEKTVLEKYGSWQGVLKGRDYETRQIEYSCPSFCTSGACSAACRSAFPKYDQEVVISNN